MIIGILLFFLNIDCKADIPHRATKELQFLLGKNTNNTLETQTIVTYEDWAGHQKDKNQVKVKAIEEDSVSLGLAAPLRKNNDKKKPRAIIIPANSPSKSFKTLRKRSR